MPQKDLLFPWLTVLDNATLGLEIQGVSGRGAQRGSQTLIDRFGLNGFEQRYPAELSGGMRQRAAFLRTVLFGAMSCCWTSLWRARRPDPPIMQEWLLSLWTAAPHDSSSHTISTRRSSYQIAST